MDSYIIILPKGLTKKELLPFEGKPLDINYSKYIIYYILKKLAFTIEQDNINEGDNEEGKTFDVSQRYIPFGKSVQHVRHDRHKQNIDFLTNNNFDKKRSRTTIVKKSVLYRENYEAGKKPFAYRLSDMYKKKVIEIDYIHDQKLIKKIRDEETKIHPVVNSGKYKFLKKYFDFQPKRPNLLTINLDEAINLCNTRYKEHDNYGKYLNEANQIVDLNNGLFRIYYNKDSDGRLHTNITRLPKVYRKFLRYNNTPLVEVDLSNSIVYLMAIIITKSLSIDLVSKYPILLMIYKSFESIGIKEIQEFEELSISGQIYDYFMPLFEEFYDENKLKWLFKKISDDDYIGSEEQKRKFAKKRLLGMFFAESKDYKNEQEIFKTKFPQLLEQMNNFKDTHGHNKLSHALFQLEAFCMIDVSARRFNKENQKNAPIFTLHDCLITTVGHEDILRETMEKSFKETLGISPNTKTKKWD